jgi:hypothetical protein
LYQTTSQFEEGQKIDAMRKLYQRAIENPMHNLEGIWKEYDAFENGLNKIIVRSSTPLVWLYIDNVTGQSSADGTRAQVHVCARCLP